MPRHAVSLRVNGTAHSLTVEPRSSLLDTLREDLGLTGTKKGCNQGGCGACTVLVDGRRVVSCLTLTVQNEGAEVTTIEGIDDPLQGAFVEADGLQCGFCTPGQICSAVAMLDEHKDGLPSHVTEDVSETPELTEAEIRERMSGNLCRCGAYNGIVEAIESVLGDRVEEPVDEGTEAADDRADEMVEEPA